MLNLDYKVNDLLKGKKLQKLKRKLQDLFQRQLSLFSLLTGSAFGLFFYLIGALHSGGIPIFWLFLLPMLFSTFASLLNGNKLRNGFKQKDLIFKLCLGLSGIFWLVGMFLNPAYFVTTGIALFIVYFAVKHEIESGFKKAIEEMPGTEAMMDQKVEELKGKVQIYEVKLQELDKKYLETSKYLNDVDAQLDDPQTNAANRKVAIHLKESLEKMTQRLDRLIRFYSLAKERYETAQHNIKHQKKNLEIMGFLRGQEDLTEIAQIERTFLNLEFEKELEAMEDKLPAFEFSMEMTAEDYSDDSQRLLEESISRLESL